MTVPVPEHLRPDGAWNHQFAEIHGGRIHYVREGEGRPLFLLHGWPEFWWSWHRVIPALAKQFELIVPDLRGFGDSDKALQPGDRAPDLQSHADDILALADALGIQHFGIVSHDVGAHIAQQIARGEPHRLGGLFFFNGPYPGIGRRWVDAHQVQEIWYQSFNQQPWAAELVGHSRETCRIYFENMLRHWTHRTEVLDGLMEHWVDNFMKPGNIRGGFAWYVSSHAARIALVANGAPALARISVPSRFYWGRHDPITRCEWVDRLEDYFEDPVVEIAEDAGHFVHLEIPEQAIPRIVEFFTSVGH